MNGKASSFHVPDDTKFCFQHHARFVDSYDDIEIISLYDNSAHGTEHGTGSEVHTAPTSSGKIIKMNKTTMEASLVQGFFPPENQLRSKSQGSTQLLPNGNVLVNWGSEGAMTEFTSDGTALFHAYMDSGALDLGVENYRAFRYNWTGIPTEEPAIVALEGEDGATTIYVSWNGDTETKAWRFYVLTDDVGSKEFLGEVERTSFETSFKVPGGGKMSGVSAEAVGENGRVLRVTGDAVVEQEILPPSSKKTVDDVKDIDEGSNWEEYAILKLMRIQKQPSEL